MFGLKHINIPIQLDLWGNEVTFRGWERNKQQYTDGKQLEIKATTSIHTGRSHRPSNITPYVDAIKIV
jgi:hypothetical protein